MPEINLPNASQLEQLINKKRNVLIHEVKDVVVSAGGYVQLTSNLNLEKHPIIYATIKADVRHAFKMNVAYDFPQTEKVNIIDSISSLYGQSEWVEVRGTTLRSYLVNSDSVDHTYTVMIFGIS